MKKKVLKRLVVFSTAITLLVSGMTVFAAETTYTTKTGDNLSKIAKQFYGDALKWREIYESNKNQIKDPNVIYSNQTLIIPDLGAESTTTTDITTEPAPQEQNTTNTYTEENKTDTTQNNVTDALPTTLYIQSTFQYDEITDTDWYTFDLFKEAYIRFGVNDEWRPVGLETTPEEQREFTIADMSNAYVEIRGVGVDGAEYNWKINNLLDEAVKYYGSYDNFYNEYEWLYSLDNELPILSIFIYSDGSYECYYF